MGWPEMNGRQEAAVGVDPAAAGDKEDMVRKVEALSGINSGLAHPRFFPELANY